MKTKRIAALFLAVLTVAVLFTGCGTDKLKGRWVCEYDGIEVMTFEFRSGGKGTMETFGEAFDFTYQVNGDELRLTTEIDGEEKTDKVPFYVDGDTLTLKLDGEEIKLTKE